MRVRGMVAFREPVGAGRGLPGPRARDGKKGGIARRHGRDAGRPAAEADDGRGYLPRMSLKYLACSASSVPSALIVARYISSHCHQSKSPFCRAMQKGS